MKLLKDKEFYRDLLRLSLPVAAQNLLISSLNFIDTMMIGQLGDVPVAAVGLANQFYFLFILLQVGINSGTSIFVAQFWGKKDHGKVRTYFCTALIHTAISSLCFVAAAYFLPELILSFFTKDGAVISVGSAYLRYVCLAYIFHGVSFSMTSALRSTENVKLPLCASATGVACNIALNYILIFGKFGFPVLGVVGAAIATVSARAIECLIMLISVQFGNYSIRIRKGDLKRITRKFINRYYSVVMPVIINEITWSVGIVVLISVFSHIGTPEIAAVNIVHAVERLASVTYFGLGIGAGILIGKRIGEQRYDSARQYAYRISIISPLTAVALGFIIFFSKGMILSMYDVSALTSSYASSIMNYLALLLWVLCFNFTTFIAVFRSAGDTKFCLWIDIGTVWLIQIPVAFFTAFYMKLPVHLVYLSVYGMELLKALVMGHRLLSDRWLNDLTVDSELSVIESQS